MDNRSFESGASATPPSAPVSPSVGHPTKGNPALGVPATQPGDYWFYQIGEELRAVIAAAGITPDRSNLTQLSQAIQQLIAAGGIKMPVRAATTANIASLAGGAPNTLDGVTLAANDRILVKDQTTGSQNGLYVVTTLGTGSNGTWTRATDADGVGELFAGMLVMVSEGTVNADTLWELSTDGAITIGTTSLTFARKDSSSGATVQGSFKNLQLSAAGTAASISVSYDELVLGDGNGNYVTERNVSGTITTTNTGAGGLDTGTLAVSTWYSIWRIGKTDGTRAWLFSLSATAPTMPSGYTLKARIGWFRTDATNKYPLSFVQHGRRVDYKVATGSNVANFPIMASGAQGSISVPTWVAVGVSGFVPTTASSIRILNTDASGGEVIISPSGAHGALGSLTNPPFCQDSGAGGFMGMPMEIHLESTNIYRAAASGNTTCIGWEDNL